MRDTLLNELRTASLMGEMVGGSRFYVPFVAAKIAAHQWLQLITTAASAAACQESQDLMTDDNFTVLVDQTGQMRDFLQIILSNLCVVSEYFSRNWEQGTSADTCVGDSTIEGRHRLVNSLMEDFKMVSKKAERVIDRMDKHASICGSAASVRESRKSIELSRKVGYVDKPPDYLGPQSGNQADGV